MERRQFLKVAGGAALVPSLVAAAPLNEDGGDSEAVKARIVDWYRVFGNPRADRDHYRSFMTDDYLLLENGELLDRAGDLAMFGSLPADHVRTDRFDFRYVRVDGNHAYAVYFLESDINDSKKGPRHFRWLESALLRREGGEWRAAVLHSTKINPAS